MDEIVFVYLVELNPLGEYIDGVPLHDLTAADVDRLPKHLLSAVKRSSMYGAVELGTSAASADAADQEHAVFVPPAVAGAAARQGRRGASLATKEIDAAVVAAPIDSDADKE